jgi:hypothetical protein
MPATDPYGDAWHCIGDGSTFTDLIGRGGGPQAFQLSLRGVTPTRRHKDLRESCARM